MQAESAPAARLDWADVAKGVTIIVVVMFHVSLTMHGLGIESHLNVRGGGRLSPYPMALFFCISGLFAATSANLKWREFFARRVAWLVAFFLIFTLVRWVFFSFFDNPVLPFEGRDIKMLPVMLLYPMTGLWFLYALAWFMVLTKAGTQLIGPRAFLVAALALAVFGEYMNWQAADLLLKNMTRLYVFFVIGWVFREAIIEIVRKRPVWTFGLTAVAFVAVSQLVRTPIEPLLIPPLRVLERATTVAAAILGSAVLLQVAALNGFTKLMAYLGRRSLVIYVAHLLIVTFLVYGLLAIGVAEWGPWIALVGPLTTAVAIALSVGARETFTRLLPQRRLKLSAQQPDS